MQTIDERCFGHEPAQSELGILRAANEMQSKRIDWTVTDNVKKAIEIDRLNEILADRNDTIKSQKRVESFLEKVNFRMGCRIRILESRIRNDNRSFAKQP